MKTKYDKDARDAASALWAKLQETPTHRQHEAICAALKDYACVTDKQLDESKWAGKYRQACIAISDYHDDLEQWQKRSGELHELTVTLKRHATEAQAMYGVHAEDLIADADRVLAGVNSSSLPAAPSNITFDNAELVPVDLARTLERELATEREKVRTLRLACDQICEEWGINHDANPIGAGQRMSTRAGKALEATEDKP